MASGAKSGVQVRAVVGSITSCDADTIICPINGKLDYHLSRKDGRETLAHQVVTADKGLVRFIEETKRKQDGLAAGEVLAYKSSRSPNVVLATGPTESDYVNLDECYTDLRSTFVNCFEEACRLDAMVVAVPAISAGHGGVDGTQVIQILIEALDIFLTNYSQRSTVQKILFVTVDRDMKNQFETMWSSKLSSTNSPHLLKSNTSTVGSSSSVNNTSVANNLSRKGIHDKTKALPASTSGRNRVRQDRAQSCDASASESISDTEEDAAQDEIDSAPIGKRTTQSEEKCPICLEDVRAETKKEIPGCKHVLCKDCFVACKRRSPVCPVCRKAFGVVSGNQPKGARMETRTIPQGLPGYKGFGTIVITYSIDNGIQTKDHPNPGRPYNGISRQAFLPDNAEGRNVWKLLKKAFDARLIFTVGSSVTTGHDNVVTWNDIHHKTSMIGGPEKYGYPDDSYLSRVTEDLAAKGIV